MGVINLAHVSLYMIGAYGAALVAERRGSFALAVIGGLAAAVIAGLVIEFVVIRKLYARDHVQQVLATFGLILFINEGATILVLVVAAVGVALLAFSPKPAGRYRLRRSVWDRIRRVYADDDRHRR